MSALIPANFGGVSTKFAGQNSNDDLSSGIQSSFGLIGYKGKVWSIRYRGDETQLMREDGDGAKGSIEVVILNASKAVSKIWYENGYVEGSNAAPDCFSNNGVTPEPTSLKPQCTSCAACPMNKWGSRTTPAGKAGKACSDSKRIAVVPMQDIANEMFGGPMLLRVPAASLQDLAMYGQKMQQMGYPYYAIATRVAFDPNESYPKFMFSAIRPLNDQEAEMVLAEREGHQVHRILSESEFGAPAAQEPAKPDLSSVFEQPPVEPVQKVFKQEPAVDEAAIAAKAKAENDALLAKAKKKADAEAKKAALADELAAAEAAAKAAEVTPEVIEDDEDAELAEMERKMAEMRAKKAQAAQATVAAKAKEVAPSPVAASAPSEDDAPRSPFEDDLDSMLNSLLP